MTWQHKQYIHNILDVVKFNIDYKIIHLYFT